MGKIKTIVFSGLVAAALLFTPGGCSPEQLTQADKTMTDVNEIGRAVDQFVASPAGNTLPPVIRMIMELLGVGALAAFGIYKQIRLGQVQGKSDQVSLTLRAVADAVDKLTPSVAKAVKGQVREVMDDRQIRSLADPIVDEHRSKLS
jgi:hypothetical protein